VFFPLFTDLSELEKQQLLQVGVDRHYAKGETLCRYGEDAKFFYLIIDGVIQLFRTTPDGHELTIDLLVAGDTLGESEMCQAQTCYQVSAVAVSATQVMRFSMPELKQFAKRSSLLALNLLAALSKRTQAISIEAEHKSTMSASQQAICFLQRLCILQDLDPRGFKLPFSKTLIASRLGMELETFSRALIKMRDHGVVIKGSHVAFEDIGAMDHYVCDNCSIAASCPEHQLLKTRLNSI